MTARAIDAPTGDPGMSADEGAVRPSIPGLLRIYYGALLLTLVYCFAFVDRQIFNLLVAPIKKDFGATDLEIGYLLGPAFILSYVAVGLPAGWCADRFDRSKLIIAAGIAWGIGTIGAATAGGYTGLFVSRLFVGGSEAFLFPAGMSLLADLYDRKRLPIASSIFVTASVVGGGLALLGGGLVLNATEKLGAVALPLLGTIRGWQVTLVVVGAVGLVPVLMMLTVPDVARRNQRTARKAAAEEGQYGIVDGTAYLFRRWRFYIAFFFGMASSSLVMLTISAWAPTYLSRTFALNPAEIGTRYGTLVLIFGLAGSIAAPAISSLLGRWMTYPTMQTVRLGPIMLVACSIALNFAHSELVALACLALLTFSFSFPLSMASASLQLAAPSRLRGVASAYYFIVVSLIGYGIGPTAVPLVTEHVFHDPSRIGQAISLISAVFGLISLSLLSIAVGGFRRELDANAQAARVFS